MLYLLFWSEISIEVMVSTNAKNLEGSSFLNWLCLLITRANLLKICGWRCFYVAKKLGKCTRGTKAKSELVKIWKKAKCLHLQILYDIIYQFALSSPYTSQHAHWFTQANLSLHSLLFTQTQLSLIRCLFNHSLWFTQTLLMHPLWFTQTH